MGQLIDGEWVERGYDTDSHGGEFVRESAKLRGWVTVDGTDGLQGPALDFDRPHDRQRLTGKGVFQRG